MSAKHVIILGGGVAGMSAAHELIERGFKVTVFEKKKFIPGGKARSVPVPNTGTDGRRDLPGEHGFRFFPGFYRHVTDTMSRIPYPGNKKGVLDNLTPTHTIMMARYDKPPVVTLDDLPESLADLEVMIKALFDADLGLEPGESEFFAKKVWQLMTSCQARRLNEYERLGWWEFLEADRHSKAFQDYFVLGITRSLVAAKAEKASTRTVGDIFVQLVYDMLSNDTETDRVLNGPTNDVWIDPWLKYLQEKGVEYVFDSEIEQFDADVTSENITGVWVKTGEEAAKKYTGDYYVSAVPVEKMATLISPDMKTIDPTLGYIQELAPNVSWMNGAQFYMKERTDINKGHVVYTNSEWALTSISQKQFWKDVDLTGFGNGEVKDVLSVDISDWFANGMNGKKASECTREEIIEETWAQLKKSLNIDGKEVLKDEDLLHVYLDRDIVFNTDESGGLKTKNEEPLLVNFTNTWSLRPDAFTRVNNLLLASDYVKTNTDLATMEGANEAARRAVNSIIDKSDSSAKLCKVWDLHEPFLLSLYRWRDKKRFNKGLPYNDKLPWFIKISIKVAKFFKKLFGL